MSVYLSHFSKLSNTYHQYFRKIFSKLSYALGTSRDVGFQTTCIKPYTTYPQSKDRQLLASATIIMNPLSAVENFLGNLESCPTCIMLDIYVVKPNTISVLKVAAFMYGNGVPVEKVVDCFFCMYWYRQLLRIMCCEGLVLYMV